MECSKNNGVHMVNLTNRAGKERYFCVNCNFPLGKHEILRWNSENPKLKKWLRERQYEATVNEWARAAWES